VITARAPASSANLGPGFDAAGIALDLWNAVDLEEGAFGVEIVGEGSGELPQDATHLSLRAFALFAPPERYRFRFTNAIPLERGLGSSAAAVGLGLVAGAHAAGVRSTPGDLLALGAPFEGHVDNLAAVLLGGVCVAWVDGEPHARRIADDMPAAAVAAIPAERTSTAASRTALPDVVTHADATVNAGAALMLGAAVAGGDADLLRHAFRDRLHEQYRAAGAPLLARVRELAPDALGVTLSGSGPTVIAWADRARADELATRLGSELGESAVVRRLDISPSGAHAA
jgi:homoserine kinase